MSHRKLEGKLKNRQLLNLVNELDSIKKSRGWKLLWVFWQIRLVFFPKGSRREKFAKFGYAGIGSIKKNLIRFLKNLNNGVFRKFRLRMSVFAYNFRIYRRETAKNMDHKPEQAECTRGTGTGFDRPAGIQWREISLLKLSKASSIKPILNLS